EEFAHHLERGSRAHTRASGFAASFAPGIFEIDVRGCDQPVVRGFFDEGIQVKLGSTAQSGPHSAQVIRVAMEGEVFPKVLAKPGAAHGEHGLTGAATAGAGMAPEVGRIVGDPTAGAVEVASDP